MRLLLVGPPGSGKGTQAKLLSERLNLTHLATGDLLREAILHKSPSGLRADSYMKNGKLVPDEIVNDMIAERFCGPDRPKRFVMDGYPRKISQAEFFDRLLKEVSMDLNAVIEFTVVDKELIERLSNRRICSNPDCQTPFHLISNLPKVPNVCDVCHSHLIQRTDDHEEIIRHRLKVYHDTSAALLAHYRKKGKLHRVNAHDEVENVYNKILSKIQNG